MDKMDLVNGTNIREIFIPITPRLWAVKCLKKSLVSGSSETLCSDDVARKQNLQIFQFKTEILK